MNALAIASRAALLLVIAARVLLGPLAEASPPDPTWIAGVWDDGDFDDVIAQVASLASAADSHGAPMLHRPEACSALVLVRVVPVLPLWRLPLQDRAPPLL